MKKIIFLIAFVMILVLVVVITQKTAKIYSAKINAKGVVMGEKKEGLPVIYLAGGCFWGVQAYMDKIPGVVYSEVGYANGNTANPTYEEVSHNNTGHAETVLVQYDPAQISLEKLLSIFFEIINPTILNKQGNDVGTQYRTGVFYTNEADRPAAEKVFAEEAKKYKYPIVTELALLQNYYKAENYHQKYLEKNPGGYCHINLKGADKYAK
ncbi:methionine-S-sulfoxide reductase [Elusimicrobium posterum]|uniref:peptide-methionine (S)-S-oxide reductase MsrA n=1 Tax=Elusimicrobium posterum TaxID=3116653 RepID=UPI003C7691AD